MRYRVVIDDTPHGPEFEILETCKAFHQVCLDMETMKKAIFPKRRSYVQIDIQQKDEYEWQSLYS